MARYGKETTLPPRTVLRLAREFFGPGSDLGLALTKDSLVEIGFTGSGGSVEVSARPKIGEVQTTDVSILSIEFDYWAEQFLVALTDAERGPGPFARLAAWLASMFKR
jgi:hypothetical protein